MHVNFQEPKYKKDGKILAFADVDVGGGVIVKGFRVTRGENGLFASVPSKSFVVAGQTRYVPQVLFASQDRRTQFLDDLLEAYRKWDEGKPGRAMAGSSHPPADELVE